jgi:antirestriction protein
MNTLTPKIYVACLSAYNNGYLHGEWIDATQGIEYMQDKINIILATSPIPNAEEWAIHAHENFCTTILDEDTALEKIAKLAEFITNHGDLGIEILDHTGGDMDDAENLLNEQYHGEFNSEEDFAHYWLNEVEAREIPSYLQNYIDYKSMAYDFFISDFFSIQCNYKTHVFSHS